MGLTPAGETFPTTLAPLLNTLAAAHSVPPTPTSLRQLPRQHLLEALELALRHSSSHEMVATLLQQVQHVHAESLRSPESES